MKSTNKKEEHRPRSKPAVEIASIPPQDSKLKGEGITFAYGYTDTPFGECFVAGTQDGICTFQFCDGNQEELITEMKKEWSRASFTRDNALAHDTVQKAFFPRAKDVPLKLWLKGTPFQFKVWRSLLDIPCGTVISYSKLAQLIGNPNAIRAAASAVARNPVGFIIPCHRIVRNDGTIGQYHWTPERKAAIIEWEART